jgi:hypothetical protein
MSLHAVALAVAFVVAIILGAGRPSARRASPEDDSADDGRMKRPELPARYLVVDRLAAGLPQASPVWDNGEKTYSVTITGFVANRGIV